MPVSDSPLQVSLPARAGGGAGSRHSCTKALPPEPLTLRLLGRFMARRGGQEMDPCVFANGDGARLVRFLLTHREHAVSEPDVLGGLWPDAPRVQADCSLRLAAADARRLLDQPGSGSVLCTADDYYRLCLGWHDRVDADYFEAIASMALRTHGPNRRAQLDLALAQWTGEPMPEERHSPWAAAWRERLWARRAELLRALAELPSHHHAAQPPRATAAAS